MNDPHVKSLTFRLMVDDTVSFDNPPSLEEELPSFRLCLENDLLVVELKDHFPSEAGARAFVEPFLRSWELDVALSRGQSEITFEFIRSELVDRAPPLPGQQQTIEASTGFYVMSSFDANLHVTRKQYPRPPRALAYTPDVESLWKRYQGFLKGREPLLSMGYFCPSLLQSTVGGRNNAAATYSIDLPVLDKLGALTSERGDASEARKIDQRSQITPLTGYERRWIQEAIKILIRRKAEYDFNPAATLSQITMSSFPEA